MIARSKRFRTALGMAAVLSTLAACEVITRVFFAFIVGPGVLAYGIGGSTDGRSIPSMIMKRLGVTPPTPEQPVGAYSKFAPHELKFDTDEHGQRFRPRINSRGFRGDEFSDAKAPNVVRVVTLGASSTFGYHDRDNETYPHYLEQLLNNHDGRESDQRRSFEVINLAIPHIDSEQIASLFTHEALPLDPDVVTLYAGFNDAGAGVNNVVDQRRRRSGFFGGALYTLRLGYESLRRRLLLVAFADAMSYYAGVRKYVEEDLAHLQAGKAERFLENVARIRDECAKRGIMFIAMTQQAKSLLVPPEQIATFTYDAEVTFVRDQLSAGGLPRRGLVFLVHDSIMRGLRTWTAEQNVPLTDVITAMDQDRDALLTFVHISPRGNRIIAEELARTIVSEIALESAPAPLVSHSGR